MVSTCKDNSFFINEFDESLDELFLEVIQQTDEQRLVMDAAFPSRCGGQLHFYINSDGGDSSRALSLVALMERAKALGVTVKTFVLYGAYSSGSMVAVAGTSGHRFISHFGEHMLHYGNFNGGVSGPAESERHHQSAIKHFDVIKSVYERNCKIPDLDAKLKSGNYYIDPSTAIAWKLADGYLEFSKA